MSAHIEKQFDLDHEFDHPISEEDWVYQDDIIGLRKPKFSDEEELQQKLQDVLEFIQLENDVFSL